MEEIKRGLHALEPGRRYAVRVRAYNNLGVTSEWSEALEICPPPDSTTPNPPTNLFLDFTAPDLSMSWTIPNRNTDASALTDFSHFKVTITDALAGATPSSADIYEFTTTTNNAVFTFSTNSIAFGPASDFVSVSVVTVDKTGNESAEVSGFAENFAPPQPDDPTVIVDVESIAIGMTIPDEVKDFDHIHLQGSDDGVVFSDLSTNLKSLTFVDGPFLSTVTRYYRYRIYDVFNNVSPWSSTISGSTGVLSLALPDLSDVNALLAPNANDLLIYTGTEWDATPSSIFQQGVGIHDLDFHSDVDTTGKNDNDVLTWNSSTMQWEAEAPTGVGAHGLDFHDDVDTTGKADDDVLTWNSSTMEWEAVSPLHDLDYHSNVDTTGKDDCDFLKWNATSMMWEAATPSVTVVPTTPIQIYAETIGNGVDTDFTITHSLGTRDVLVVARATASPFDYIALDIEATSINAVDVSFFAPPSLGEFRIIVLAAESTFVHSEVIGNGVDTSFVIAHGFGTRDVLVQVREAAAPYAYVDTVVEATTTTTVTIAFGAAPSSGEYEVIVVGD